jgi:glycosyltransferase involved in cell wall biosynthesis
MKKKPKISIIISAYNAEKYISECLESVFNLNYPKEDFEVIVIDDCSKDRTAEVAKRFPCRVKRNEVNKNVAGARNEGIKIARGEIIIFFDADCVATPDWLRELMKYQDGRSIVGGLDTSSKRDPILMRCIDFAMTSMIGTGGMRRKGMRFAKYYPRGFSFCVPKRAFDELGLFKEDIVPGEEVEFDLRAEKNGYTLRFSPRAVVFHKRRSTIKSFFRQIYGRGKYRMKLSRISKKHLEPLHVAPALFLVLLFSLLLLSFFSLFVFRLFLIVFFFYLAILIINGIMFAFKIKRLLPIVLVPFIIALQHFAYGLGFLKEFFKKDDKTK